MGLRSKRKMAGQIWPGVNASNFFTPSEKRTFEVLREKCGINGPLNESILSKMRAGLDQMRKDGSSDLDEQTLDKLQDIMLSSSKFAGYLDEHFTKVYDKVLAYYKGGLDEAKTALKRKILKGSFDYPKENMKQEVADLSKLSIFWLKDFKKILSDQTRDKYARCMVAESMNNTADIMLLLPRFHPAKLYEGKDPWSFLDRVKDAITGTEPFDTITGVADLVQNIGNASLNQFATLSRRIGAPKCCKLVGMGAIAGKLAELRETPVSADGIMKADPILRFMPTGRCLIESFEMIAFVVTVLELVSELKNQSKL